MLHKIIKNSFVILSAAYFLLAGGGYNIVSYCCNSCAESDIEVVEQCSSNTQLLNDDLEYQAIDVHTLNQESDTCNITRVNVDIPLIENSLQISKHYFASVDLLFTSTNLLTDNPFRAYQQIFPPPRSCFPFTGRDILALHAVYLI